eukprot:7129001-Pyramimonas_sp.AAC.1
MIEGCGFTSKLGTPGDSQSDMMRQLKLNVLLHSCSRACCAAVRTGAPAGDSVNQTGRRLARDQ